MVPPSASVEISTKSHKRVFFVTHRLQCSTETETAGSPYHG